MNLELQIMIGTVVFQQQQIKIELHCLLTLKKNIEINYYLLIKLTRSYFDSRLVVTNKFQTAFTNCGK
jgi:hypothetical protein